MTTSPRRPLQKYASPQYPTCEQRRKSAQTTNSAWLTKTKRDVAMGILSGTIPFFVGCGGTYGGQTMGEPPRVNPISEHTARAIIEEEFSRFGLEVENDYAIAYDGTSFVADGYIRDKDAGYEYISENDADNLSEDELNDIINWRRMNGPYFSILKYRDYWHYGTTYEQILRQDAAEYAAFLASQEK